MPTGSNQVVVFCVMCENKWKHKRRHFLGREYHNFSDTTMFLHSLLPSSPSFSFILSQCTHARAANNILSDSHISPVSRLHVLCVRRRRWFSFVMLPACFETVKLFSALFQATTSFMNMKICQKFSLLLWKDGKKSIKCDVNITAHVTWQVQEYYDDNVVIAWWQKP